MVISYRNLLLWRTGPFSQYAVKRGIKGTEIDIRRSRRDLFFLSRTLFSVHCQIFLFFIEGSKQSPVSKENESCEKNKMKVKDDIMGENTIHYFFKYHN